MTANRELFESWFWATRKNKHRTTFARLSDDTYADDHAQRHWWTWQAAIAAQAPTPTTDEPLRRELAATDEAQQSEEPVAWVDGRAIAWLEGRSKAATITTKLQAAKSIERPMPIYTAPQTAQPVYPLPDNLYPDSKDWMAGGYPQRVEWLYSMYASSKQTLDAYLAQPAQPGWVSVPVEPTEAMLSAGHDAGLIDSDAWAAMVAAARRVDAQIETDGKALDCIASTEPKNRQRQQGQDKQ